MKKGPFVPIDSFWHQILSYVDYVNGFLNAMHFICEILKISNIEMDRMYNGLIWTSFNKSIV